MSSKQSRLKASLSRKRYFANMTSTEYADYCKNKKGIYPSFGAKKKMSEAHKKVWANKSSKEKQKQLARLHNSASKRFTGRKHTEETKLKMSEARRNYWENIRNHKIVSIKILDIEDVYDFTVPGDNNAMLSNGVIVHNCHFSVLQEYLAACIGVPMGKYYQISNNFHAYKAEFDKRTPKEFWNKPISDPYKLLDFKPTSIVTVPSEFDNDLRLFMDKDGPKVDRCKNIFFYETAAPMFLSYKKWRAKNKQAALDILETMPKYDWYYACRDWYARRLQKSTQAIDRS